MSNSITFTTEAERLKAREQYVAIACTVNDARGREAEGLAFDFAFPPITPPKMVPFEAWLWVRKDDPSTTDCWFNRGSPSAAEDTDNGWRYARVRVVEVDDE